MYKLLIEQYNEYILLALTGLLIIVIIMQAITWAKMQKLKKNYQRLTKGIDNQNLEQLILYVNDQVDENNKQLLNFEVEHKELKGKVESCLKAPKIVRYNAFDNMGSNLSFSISLLDQEDNGVVLTSIYGRDESRFYAKSINSGKSEQLLSPEEKEVLEQAQG